MCLYVQKYFRNFLSFGATFEDKIIEQIGQLVTFIFTIHFII